jgi:hypothetical protein
VSSHAWRAGEGGGDFPDLHLEDKELGAPGRAPTASHMHLRATRRGERKPGRASASTPMLLAHQPPSAFPDTAILMWYAWQAQVMASLGWDRAWAYLDGDFSAGVLLGLDGHAAVGAGLWWAKKECFAVEQAWGGDASPSQGFIL